MISDNHKDLLIEVRRVVRNGWCKGSFGPTEDGCFCIRGAFNQAAMTTGIMGWDPIYRAQEMLVRHPRVSPHFGLVSFNDHPDTTKEDVLAVLDDVIARAV